MDRVNWPGLKFRLNGGSLSVLPNDNDLLTLRPPGRKSSGNGGSESVLSPESVRRGLDRAPMASC
jgi:hypothetical protein